MLDPQPMPVSLSEWGVCCWGLADAFPDLDELDVEGCVDELDVEGCADEFDDCPFTSKVWAAQPAAIPRMTSRTMTRNVMTRNTTARKTAALNTDCIITTASHLA